MLLWILGKNYWRKKRMFSRWWFHIFFWNFTPKIRVYSNVDSYYSTPPTRKNVFWNNFQKNPHNKPPPKNTSNGIHSTSENLTSPKLAGWQRGFSKMKGCQPQKPVNHWMNGKKHRQVWLFFFLFGKEGRLISTDPSFYYLFMWV